MRGARPTLRLQGKENTAALWGVCPDLLVPAPAPRSLMLTRRWRLGWEEWEPQLVPRPQASSLTEKVVKARQGCDGALETPPCGNQRPGVTRNEK